MAAYVKENYKKFHTHIPSSINVFPQFQIEQDIPAPLPTVYCQKWITAQKWYIKEAMETYSTAQCDQLCLLQIYRKAGRNIELKYYVSRIWQEETFVSNKKKKQKPDEGKLTIDGVQCTRNRTK